MMELTPIPVDGAVVLNSSSPCRHSGSDCRECPEVAVGIHNWLLSCDLSYLIVDFQDEKEVCQTFLIELLQLRKRLSLPFLFIGLMDKARELIVYMQRKDKLHELRKAIMKLRPELASGDNQERQRIHRRLTEATTVWSANNHDSGYLYPGGGLG